MPATIRKKRGKGNTMAFLQSLNISGSALTAQKFRMNIISQNIANAQTTRTAEGGPYVKKNVVLRSSDTGLSFPGALRKATAILGVEVSSVGASGDAATPVYDPDHPDADENGYVLMPNVDTVEEMIDMMMATRSYEANITAFNAVKAMAAKALEIGR